MGAENKKIFIGVTNTAGISIRLKEGFGQIGIKADFYHFNGHPYQYKSDKKIKYSKNGFIRKLQKFILIINLLLKYDYYIFLSPYTLLKDFLDVKIFRTFGKKVMIIFVGCDVRIPEKVEGFKWNPCINCPQEYKDFVSCVIPQKKNVIAKVESTFDIIVCPEEGSGFLSRNFIRAYFPINLEDYKLQNQSHEIIGKLKILHAPSSEAVKGSKYIIDTIDKLKTKYDFEFTLTTNASVNQVRENILSSDLIIDQMLVGFYGLFAIEAMSLSKPVVCYMREDIWNRIKGDCPVYNADPDTLYEVLEEILKNPGQLSERGRLSRRYVELYHDSKKIAEQYYNLLNEL